MTAPGRRPGLAGVILAGGRSSRFGSDKASALLLGRPLLQWAVEALSPVCDELVIVAAEGQHLPAIETTLPMTRAIDTYEAKGPLAGLATGFAHASASLAFATSCDAPLIVPELVRALAAMADDYDIVCPFVGGFMQPLTAVYRPAACRPIFQDFIARDVLKITAAFGPLRVRLVRDDEVRRFDPGFASFENANRPEALHRIEQRLSRS